MSARRATTSPSGPDEVPGWALRAASAVDAVLLMLTVTVVWWMLTLLGGVLLGVAPASCAAGDLFRARGEGRDAPVLRTMWRSYRGYFLGATLLLGPFLLVQLGAVATLSIVLAGGAPGSVGMLLAAVPAAIAGGWSSVAVAALATTPVLRGHRLVPGWRAALLAPAVVPLASALTVLSLVMVLAVTWVLPPLGILLGAGGAVQASRSLVGGRLEAVLMASEPGADPPSDGTSVRE